ARKLYSRRTPSRPFGATLDRRQRDHRQGLPQPARRSRAPRRTGGKAVRFDGEGGNTQLVAHLISRAVSVLTIGWMLSISLAVDAQQAQTKSIGLLVPPRLTALPGSPVFLETLKGLGYRDGDNLRLLVKEAGGDLGRLP